jgi:hypothetical protein
MHFAKIILFMPFSPSWIDSPLESDCGRSGADCNRYKRLYHGMDLGPGLELEILAGHPRFGELEKWLGEEPANDNELKTMLKPFPSERMSAWPVGKAVGSVKNDTPDLIERAANQASPI